jgi:hypothetical protein
MGIYAQTPESRLSYPSLFEARPPLRPGGAAKFEATFLVPKGSGTWMEDPALADLRAAVVKARDEKWATKEARPKGLRYPFLDGDATDEEGDRKFGEECAGHWVVRSSSHRKPEVVDAALKEVMNREDVYAGCYVKGYIDAYAYAGQESKGVTFGLAAIQKRRDGEPFGSDARPAAASVFTAVEGAAPAATSSSDFEDEFE